MLDPRESFPRRWLKLLLYLLIGVGFGDPDADEAIAFSGTTGTPRKDAGIPAVSEDLFLAWVRALIPELREYDCGEGGGNISPACEMGAEGTGDAEREPALNGWKDADGRLAIAIPSKGLVEDGLTG